MISNKPELTLPHRKPFLWVDRLMERNADGSEGMAECDIRADLELFRGHFPDNPVFPGVLQMESSGQACIWIRYGELTPEWSRPEVLLVSCKDYKFKKPILPNSVLQNRCKIVSVRAGMQMWNVESYVNQELVSKGTCWIKMSDPRKKDRS